LVKINTNIPETETQIPEIYLSDILLNGSPYLKKIKENTINIPWNYNSLSIHLRIKNRGETIRTIPDSKFIFFDNIRI